MGKEVRDDSLWENVRGNTGRDGGVTPGQNGAKRNKGGSGGGRSAASPVAQSATKVCVCLRTIPSLSLGRGSLRMMCSTKSLGVTEAMFHFNFPSTTSSQSWKQKERIKWSTVFITDLETPSSDPLLSLFFSQEMAQQHFSTFPLLAVSYYLHAFLIPRILCVHIASMWQALPCSEALPMKHPAPSFLSQACSGHNELAAASSSGGSSSIQSAFVSARKKVHACCVIQFPVCVASSLTIPRFIDVF